MKQGRQRFYAGAIDIPEGTSGDIMIRHTHKPAGTVLHSSTLRTAIYGQRGEALTFDQPTRWHELSEEGQGVWMTDLPVEQRQMDELIAKAAGRVIVGGLGVGYAVVALATRPRVKSITVIERNADIIKLVWDATLAKVNANHAAARDTVIASGKLVLPKRPTCEVIHADLFDYLKERPAFYQWGLFDIWQSDGEGTFHETVVPLRQLAHGMVRTVTCWNEDIMRGQLLHGLQSRLFLLLHPVEALTDSINLDHLCTDTDNVYQQWAVPFWRWYRTHKDQLNEAAVQHAMHRYAMCYGQPDVQDRIFMPVKHLAELFGGSKTMTPLKAATA